MLTPAPAAGADPVGPAAGGADAAGAVARPDGAVPVVAFAPGVLPPLTLGVGAEVRVGPAEVKGVSADVGVSADDAGDPARCAAWPCIPARVNPIPSPRATSSTEASTPSRKPVDERCRSQ